MCRGVAGARRGTRRETDRHNGARRAIPGAASSDVQILLGVGDNSPKVLLAVELETIAICVVRRRPSRVEGCDGLR